MADDEAGYDLVMPFVDGDIVSRVDDNGATIYEVST